MAAARFHFEVVDPDVAVVDSADFDNPASTNQLPPTPELPGVQQVPAGRAAWTLLVG